MNIKVLVVVLCVVVFTLAIWNNARYSRANQELESIKKEQDSICLMRNESILYTIQTNAQTIDSLVQEHKSVDSTYLKNQELILKQMEILISIEKEILMHNSKLRCSILSTIHTAE